MLKKYVSRNHQDWDRYIGQLLAAYRATHNPATGYSPNMLMFGREVNMPNYILFPFPKAEDSSDIHEYVAELRNKMEECFHIVRKNLNAAAERQTRDHDSRTVEYGYEVGDIVYKKEAAGRKTDEIYSGPFLITKCCSASVYEIQGKKTKLVVHHDRLKKYESETVQSGLSS